jgi:hypothetical protein
MGRSTMSRLPTARCAWSTRARLPPLRNNCGPVSPECGQIARRLLRSARKPLSPGVAPPLHQSQPPRACRWILCTSNLPLIPHSLAVIGLLGNIRRGGRRGDHASWLSFQGLFDAGAGGAVLAVRGCVPPRLQNLRLSSAATGIATTSGRLATSRPSSRNAEN